MLRIVALNVLLLYDIVCCVLMLNVIMLSVILQSVVLLNVAAPQPLPGLFGLRGFSAFDSIENLDRSEMEVTIG
jgi:hypothetical protein